MIEADTLANEVLKLARQQYESDPRSLGVSLAYKGDTARALGRLEDARNAHQEAAVLLRRLDHVFPGQEYENWLAKIEAKISEVGEKSALP